MVYVTTNDAKTAVADREREILAALGIELPQRRNVHRRCPYPDHPDHHPSWRWDDKDACAHCTCSHAGIFDVAIKMRGGEFEDAKIFAIHAIGRHDLIRGQDDGPHHRPEPPPRPVTPSAPKPSPEEVARERAEKIAYALSWWNAGIPIDGTLAARYLDHRRVLSEALQAGPEVLRFHPNCVWKDGQQPCLLSLIRDIETNEPIGIQRTAIAPQGEKLGRQSLGYMAGGAIKITANAEVEYGLHIAEGLETTLSAVQLGFHPAWCVLGKNGIRQFPVLDGIDALAIIIDHDDHGGGQAAADACADRWLVAGREVFRHTPENLGDDFNDIAGDDDGALSS